MEADWRRAVEPFVGSDARRSSLEGALPGSSHRRLPAFLQWFTGTIGLRHVRHVAPTIPNYRLQSRFRDVTPAMGGDQNA